MYNHCKNEDEPCLYFWVILTVNPECRNLLLHSVYFHIQVFPQPVFKMYHLAQIQVITDIIIH